MENKEIWFLPHTVHKNAILLDCKHKFKGKIIKLSVDYFYYVLEEDSLKVLITNEKPDKLTKLNSTSCHHNLPLTE